MTESAGFSDATDAASGAAPGADGPPFGTRQIVTELRRTLELVHDRAQPLVESLRNRVGQSPAEADEPHSPPPKSTDHPTAGPSRPAEGADEPLGCAQCGFDASAQGESAAPPADSRHATGHCDRCPVCLAIAVLRGERPEIGLRLAEQAMALLGALRTLVHEPSSENSATRDPASEPTAADSAESAADTPAAGSAAPEAPTSRVQRIDVTRTHGC